MSDKVYKDGASRFDPKDEPPVDPGEVHEAVRRSRLSNFLLRAFDLTPRVFLILMVIMPAGVLIVSNEMKRAERERAAYMLIAEEAIASDWHAEVFADVPLAVDAVIVSGLPALPTCERLCTSLPHYAYSVAAGTNDDRVLTAPPVGARLAGRDCVWEEGSWRDANPCDELNEIFPGPCPMGGYAWNDKTMCGCPPPAPGRSWRRWTPVLGVTP